MGTRSNIIIADDDSRIQLYRHWDGYPDGKSGVLANLEKAFPYAWPLPRFEADDLAAAIIRAWTEEGGGNIYIDGTPKRWEQIHNDVEWVYIIQPQNERQKNNPTQFPGELEVAIYDWHNYWFDKTDPEKARPKPLSQVRLLQAKKAGMGWKHC